MASDGRTGMGTKLVFVALFGANIALGDGFCCFSSPKTWQYHQDVCFGHYQTKWRRWEEACGPQPRLILESPPPVASIGDAYQPSRKPNIVIHAAPPSAELAVPVNPVETPPALNPTPKTNQSPSFRPSKQ